MAVLWRVGVVLGLVLIGMGSLLSYLRQEPSPAYWIITEKAPDFPQFYGYYLMDSSGAIRQRLDTATAASNSTWFVTWTPDGRYVFYRVNDNRDGQPHGLYVYDLRRNERRMVIEANIGRNSVTMNLSPDGHWYMVTIADSETQAAYLISYDGRDARQLLPDETIVWSQDVWSADSQWVSFRRSDENLPQIYRLNIDTAKVEATGNLIQIPSPDGQAAAVLDAETLTWAIVEHGSDIQTPIESEGPIQNIIAWLPTDWLLLWELYPPTATNGSAVTRIYRVRPDGHGHALLAEITTGSPFPLIPFWSADGQFIYYATRTTQGNLVERINVDTLEREPLIEDYDFTTAVPVSLERTLGDPFEVLWVRKAEWLVWYERDRVGLEYYYQVRPDGSQRRLLYRAPSLSNDMRAYEDPTGHALLIDFWENELGFDPIAKHIERVNLDTREVVQLSSGEHRIVALSNLVDGKHRSLLWVIIGSMFTLSSVGWHLKVSKTPQEFGIRTLGNRSNL